MGPIDCVGLIKKRFAHRFHFFRRFRLAISLECRGILISKQLRLGSYRKLVRVLFATSVRDEKSKKWLKGPEKLVERESAPVCCVADIPVAQLSHNTGRYGKIAIGFLRDPPVRARFNPSLYAEQFPRDENPASQYRGARRNR